MTEDEEILLAFLEESRENLDQLDRDLVDLESRPQDPQLLAQVFRVVHTIKGTCGFLGLSRLEQLTHAGEDLLGALRAGELVLDVATTTSLLQLVDAVRATLAAIEETGAEPDDDHAALVDRLRSHLPVAAAPTVVEPATQAPVDPVPLPGQLVESSVRVDVGVLDRLMDLVGELVLARSRIGALAEADDDGPLAGPYRDLRLVSAELQDSVMAARLQPIGIVIGKFHRIARDLATALGKNVQVELTGEDVGVDKAVNETLRDPLLHLVRNAVDHGIELPAERVAADKPAIGTLRIRAFHEGGRVHLEVSDDGRGIDAAAVVAKAVAAGVVTPEAAESLTASEALDLVFAPGLSTRDEVTSTSGRGVGADVVRSALEHVGGSVDVVSEPGVGTTFRLNLPLTLAIMPVLVVECGGARYAVPQVHLHEVVALTVAEVAERVDVVEGARLLRLRGRLVPLVDLAARLGVTPQRRDDALLVVLVETDGRRFGVVVDAVGDAVDAVVKPLPRLLRGLPAYAGTTVLGDGLPALVLDVPGLAAEAGIAAGAEDDEVVSATGPASAGLLLATAADGGRLAVRTSQVLRLESFAPGRVELVGQREVVQYGDALLPLARVGDLLPERRSSTRSPTAATAATTDGLATVVCRTAVGPVGFVVASIDDVVDEPPLPSQPASRPGVEACLVLGDRVAELLDLDRLAADAGVEGPA